MARSSPLSGRHGSVRQSFDAVTRRGFSVLPAPKEAFDLGLRVTGGKNVREHVSWRANCHAHTSSWFVGSMRSHACCHVLAICLGNSWSRATRTDVTQWGAGGRWRQGAWEAAPTCTNKKNGYHPQSAEKCAFDTAGACPILEAGTQGIQGRMDDTCLCQLVSCTTGAGSTIGQQYVSQDQVAPCLACPHGKGSGVAPKVAY